MIKYVMDEEFGRNISEVTVGVSKLNTIIGMIFIGIIMFLIALMGIIFLLLKSLNGFLVMCGFFIFALIMFFIAFRMNKKLNEGKIKEEFVDKLTTTRKGSEKVLLTVFGLMKVPQVALGGVVTDVENSAIITDKRIILFAVPYEGYNLPNTSIVSNYFDIDKLRQEGKKIVDKMDLDQIVNMEKSNKSINLNDCKKIILRDLIWGFLGIRKFKIKTNDKTYTYAIYNQTDLDSLKVVLKDHT